jgi:hypothetical protein
MMMLSPAATKKVIDPTASPAQHGHHPIARGHALDGQQKEQRQDDQGQE